VPKITIEEFNAILRDEIPWGYEIGIRADVIERGKAVLRLPYQDTMLRPGGTIAGPMMMALADACMYAVALSMIGKVKLAVTTSSYDDCPAGIVSPAILKAGKSSKTQPFFSVS